MEFHALHFVWCWVEEVEDVYDGHHVMEKPTTTTETKTVPKATKKSTTTAVHRGDTQPRSLNINTKQRCWNSTPFNFTL